MAGSIRDRESHLERGCSLPVPCHYLQWRDYLGACFFDTHSLSRSLAPARMHSPSVSPIYWIHSVRCLRQWTSEECVVRALAGAHAFKSTRSIQVTCTTSVSKPSMGRAHCCQTRRRECLQTQSRSLPPQVCRSREQIAIQLLFNHLIERLHLSSLYLNVVKVCPLKVAPLLLALFF